jgi:hypothetical protein
VLRRSSVPALLASTALVAAAAAGALTPVAPSGPPAGVRSDRVQATSGGRLPRQLPFRARAVAAIEPRLTWGPPRLRNPRVLNVGDGIAPIKLDPARDYVLRLPAARAARRPLGLVVTGGRNIVLRGGLVDVLDGAALNGEIQRRAMYLKGQTGVVFVEGVRFISSTKIALTEGINLDQRLGATVILQNIRLAPLRGSYTTNHADGLQTWAGPRRLLVDGLWMDTNYQGLFLLPNQHFSGPAPQMFYLRRVSILGQPGSGYLVWRSRAVFPLRADRVFVRPAGGPSTQPARYLWDPSRLLAGVTPVWDPPQVATTAGLGYLTPGYPVR